MTENYAPPKVLIDKLVKEQSPEKLAVAYLRAQRRAIEAQMELERIKRVAQVNGAEAQELKGEFSDLMKFFNDIMPRV